jgi:hypothetical protein
VAGFEWISMDRFRSSSQASPLSSLMVRLSRSRCFAASMPGAEQRSEFLSEMRFHVIDVSARNVIPDDSSTALY